MGKYDRLQHHLRVAELRRIRLTFDEVEKIIGFSLPESARQYPAWWSNNAKGHSHSRAWIDSGWLSQEVDLAGEAVTFVRKDIPQTLSERRKPSAIFGALKGTVRVSADADLTAPADERWAAQEGKL